MELAYFGLFGVVALLGALVTVLHRNMAQAVGGLLVTVLALAGLGVLLGPSKPALLITGLQLGAIALPLMLAALSFVSRDEPYAQLGPWPRRLAFLSVLPLAGLSGFLTWQAASGPVAASPPLALPLPSAPRLLHAHLLGLLLLASIVVAARLLQVDASVAPGRPVGEAADEPTSAASAEASAGRRPSGPAADQEAAP